MVLACVTAALAGCAGAPASPPPPTDPAPVLCAASAGQTELEARPDKPTGTYSQRAVAAYIEQLHRWGTRGWEKVAAVRAWSNDCVDRAAVRAGSPAR
ncbi:hypothetical protein [Bordetella petrii]|nr:hypothetical protein [Bordetella petrii]